MKPIEENDQQEEYVHLDVIKEYLNKRISEIDNNNPCAGDIKDEFNELADFIDVDLDN